MDIIPGKEYIYVPRGEDVDASLAALHGRTIIVSKFYGAEPHIYVGYFGGDEQPFAVFADELVDPEGDE